VPFFFWLPLRAPALKPGSKGGSPLLKPGSKEALLYKTEKLKCFLLKRTKGRTKGRRREREKAMIRDVDVFGTWLFWLFMLLFLTCAFGSDFIGCAMLVVYLGGIISFCMLLLGALAHGVLN
jgi:hypothetical protein